MKTPLAGHFQILADLSPQTREKYLFRVFCASAVGSIIHAIVYTHLDISHAVIVVS